MAFQGAGINPRTAHLYRLNRCRCLRAAVHARFFLGGGPTQHELSRSASLMVLKITLIKLSSATIVPRRTVVAD